MAPIVSPVESVRACLAASEPSPPPCACSPRQISVLILSRTSGPFSTLVLASKIDLSDGALVQISRQKGYQNYEASFLHSKVREITERLLSSGFMQCAHDPNCFRRRWKLW